MVLSLIFLCVVAALPGDFFKHGEIYRQLPLYCFLEKKALQEENGQDRETEMLLQEKNAEHLGEEVEAENRKEQEALLLAEAEKAEEKESPESVQKPSDSAETKKTDGKQKENVEKKDEIKKETSQKKRNAGNYETGRYPVREHSDKNGSKRKEDLWRRSRKNSGNRGTASSADRSVSCETGRF